MKIDLSADWLTPVIAAHGRELVELVFAAQMATETLTVLAATRVPAAPLAMLAENFNTISNAYVAKAGWTEAQLNAADSAIQLAYKTQLIVPAQAIIH